MRLLADALRVARLEADLFRRFPKLRLSVIGIAVIPALYAFIYLQSVWDPAGRTAELPALVVNQDRGAEVNGQRVSIGADLLKSLQARRTFGFSESADAEAARRAVREGRALFALIVPPDFSEAAMAASAPGSGRLVIYASEGNNYAGAGFARRFAEALGHQVNETLNEQRWAAVLGASASSRDSLQRLREGVAKLHDGAGQLAAGTHQASAGSRKLAEGAGTLAEGVGALSTGVKQLGAGARELEAKKPSASDLQGLKAGADELARGQAELAAGVPKLAEGAGRLAAGAGQLREESARLPFGADKVSDAAGQLADGARQMQAGIETAAQAQVKLAGGAQSLSKGVGQLADGFGAYAAGASTLASKFPPDDRLDELAAGSRTLSSSAGQLSAGIGQLEGGSRQLLTGLAALSSALPADLPALPGTSRGLASSVEPLVEIDAPVANNGLGFAPNFIPVALWLGAVMTAFIFHLRQLPVQAQDASRGALLLGKMTVLGSINLVQALCVFLMCAFLLEMHAVHAGGLAITMVVSSLTFMLIIVALVRMFGDAGKGVALLLLILQLSSAGGIVPIELTNEFYRGISPWLPFTWSVKAVRASAFGAFASDWGTAVVVLGVFGIGACAVALLAGRWKFVSGDEHRPAMDV
ncbi:YhgE/Pip domain-containing protein [Quisquiliibacterium transsilvanicum]|uniref:Putative membrane protein n=1 Tax=Quisquiliibacterium transsilvanicum TaxID=1549638 RepID=A0A7W8HHR8_9BURK|nr:YhgE/Pip domain-containing protein [Quisquiliibacterium transsilvanicum]MBB5272255.1 putative membrane protein [Quisquiliibacterium transsilvanicum]